MDKAKKEKIMQATTYDELLDAEFGPIGTPERDQFETESDAFCLETFDRETISH